MKNALKNLVKKTAIAGSLTVLGGGIMGGCNLFYRDSIAGRIFREDPEPKNEEKLKGYEVSSGVYRQDLPNGEIFFTIFPGEVREEMKISVDEFAAHLEDCCIDAEEYCLRDAGPTKNRQKWKFWYAPIE